MRAIPAIIDTATDRARINLGVSAAHSALREAEVQEQKAADRAEKARAVTQRRRLELGKALVEARKQWPARGPKARGWGELLEGEGIPQNTALDLMRLAGYVEEISTTDGPVVEIPTVREVNAARQARRDEQPDPPAGLVDPGADVDGWNCNCGGLSGSAPRHAAGDRICMVPRATFDSDADAHAPRAPSVAIDLRLGRWQVALLDVDRVDTVIADPPYSGFTHAGSKGTRSDGVDAEGLAPSYDHWTPADVNDFVQAWAPRCRGWMVALTDSWLIEAWHAAYLAAGRYAFAPVPCVITGMTVRTRGDGPSSWAVYAMVSRPAALGSWGTLPGAYVGPAQPGAGGGRGKPRWLMDALVADYTRSNDLVCDPLAGWGTTLIAAHAAGRRAVGAELDAAAHAEALRRAAGGAA